MEALSWRFRLRLHVQRRPDNGLFLVLRVAAGIPGAPAPDDSNGRP